MFWLAKTSGVSKSIPAQIERGDGNPTISALRKLSNGLNVPFDTLTIRPREPYEIIRTAEFITVFQGTLTIKADDKTFTIGNFLYKTAINCSKISDG
ncbi:MAG: helix-turn-helix domain-containing protein [Lachnospiraceae bacterium]|nr:helix-turn-helix domain-containing protein [Lachnospiraceae bacterium]MCI9658658.1 helix-turn-helix domain-containing protein [Lachnospiraceae bacterium]